MAVNIGGPHRGHAAGNTDVEKQASQLASDVKLKVKEKMGPHTDQNPAQVVQAYERQLDSSPAPGPVKAIARKKLKIGVTEQYGINELAKQSTVNALIKVFVEGVTVEEEVEDIVEADEKKYWIVVTDKKTGNTYRRQATRAKISELRSNPNIRRVEMTGYHPKETEDKQGQKTASVKSGKGLNPGAGENYENKYGKGGKNTVGDKDGDGTIEPNAHEYAGVKDNAIKKAIAKRKGVIEEFIAEAKKLKKKTDQITGEGVNNSKSINLKPTMEQNETDAPAKNSSQDEEQKKKLKLRQQQVQMALTRQRQTMQLQRSGRLPLNYSEDNNQEGDDIQEVAPPGFEGTVKAMKKYPELSKGKTPEGKEKNIYALAWFMKNKGFKSHKTKGGVDKEIQKSHYEPEGEMIGEEESDRMKDRQLERGGMGARSSSSPAKQSAAKPETSSEKESRMKKHKETSQKAFDLVRQSILAKHGKSSLK